MRGMERIQLHIAGHPPGAANPRYYGHTIQIRLRFYQRPRETVHRGADAAARTPDMWHPVHAQKRLDRVGHLAASMIPCKISSARWTPPPAWVTPMVRAWRP